MSSESHRAQPAIQLQGVAKCYPLFQHPADRLKQMLWRGRRTYYREFWALRELSLEVAPGEVLGIIGRNGAGKSTLLQLVCGTLTPTTGTVRVRGRVAALLELGAGFNPEFTGRENVHLACAILGLSRAETEERYPGIVEFSGIAPFIDRPVKTYSSGMYVRLAFAVATSVDPEILVIDEALSVGDGEFARKSFDRIMALKGAGKTILFCSHALYQVEALCNRAIWLDQGSLRMDGQPAPVVVAYNESLDRQAAQPAPPRDTPPPRAPRSIGRITGVQLRVDGETGTRLAAVTAHNEVGILVRFTSDPALPNPSVGVCLTAQDGRIVTSAGTHNDRFPLERAADGTGEVEVVFPHLALLKGNYRVEAYLMCESGIHVYDSIYMAAELEVTQTGLELGVVSLPHRWQSPPRQG